MSAEDYSERLQSRAERAVSWSDRFNEAAGPMSEVVSGNGPMAARIGNALLSLGKTWAYLPPTVATSRLFRHSLTQEIEGLETQTHMEYNPVGGARPVDIKVREYRLPGMIKFMGEIETARHIAAT